MVEVMVWVIEGVMRKERVMGLVIKAVQEKILEILSEFHSPISQEIR
jgi:hypothetical protein